MTIYVVVLGVTGGQSGLTVAVAAGAMGIGFFASGTLCERRWLKLVAAAWWAGMAAAILLRQSIEATLLGAALFLLLMGVPGVRLARRGA
jgi:hypothetical protein